MSGVASAITIARIGLGIIAVKEGIVREGKIHLGITIGEDIVPKDSSAVVD